MGEASKFNISGKKEYKSKSIEFETGKFKKIIGFSISENEIKKILNSLGFSTKSVKKKTQSHHSNMETGYKSRNRFNRRTH